MTRFARARGSKAENARVPEEATSWAKMRADMRAASAARGAGNPEEEDDGEGEAVVAVAAAGDDGLDSEGEPMEVAAADSDSEESEDGQEEEDSKVKVKVKTEALAQGATQVADGPEVAGEVKKKKKRKRREDKCLQCKERGHRKMDCPTLTEERRKELRELLVLKRERKGKGTGRKKNKNKGSAAAGGGEKVQSGRVEKKKEAADGKKDGKKKKKKKLKKDKAGQLVQDGEGLFQGFRVKKEDEARLRKLETALKSKGLAGAELSAELKKERRRAEKDLARFHKDVCYGCRQPGHQLAACPQAQRQVLDKDVLHSGQCYKCGSDDHTSKECKSSKRKGADAFAFAVCFICKETGHLAKACPDNPRGLYPKGGGCRFCGSVEHLKSDCPRKAQKDAREEVKAERMDPSTLEVEAAAPLNRKPAALDKKKKKIVQF